VPGWAVALIRDSDEHFLEEMRAELLIEGCILLEKRGPPGTRPGTSDAWRSCFWPQTRMLDQFFRSFIARQSNSQDRRRLHPMVHNIDSSP
jgi:hypothetical protein